MLSGEWSLSEMNVPSNTSSVVNAQSSVANVTSGGECSVVNAPFFCGDCFGGDEGSTGEVFVF